MNISFRTRLVVVAALIVGTVLSLVLMLGWSSLLAYDGARLNERLCMEARRLVTQPIDGPQAPRLDVDVAEKLHLISTDQIMLRLESAQGQPEFATANWNRGLALDGSGWSPAKGNSPHSLFDVPPAPPHPPPRPRPRRDDDNQAEPRARPLPPDACFLAEFMVQGRQWRAAQVKAPVGRSVIAADLVATQAELDDAVKRTLKLVIPLALVFTVLGAWMLSALTMRPVNRLREAMKGVTQTGLDQRVETRGEDREFKELIEAFNTMLARLEASFQQASRFSADAAHELKTPLTILQGRLERAINQTDTHATEADLTELLEEVGRLSAITRKLLLLSQADAGRLALQVASIDLTATLDELAADAQMLLRDQALHCAVERQLSLRGDAVLLRQLFNNLISNAARYCRPGGWIRLSAHGIPTGIEVIFSNATAVIQLDDRARFFDRFYRGDSSHNRHIEGNGLGLSLAREIARSHGGDLTLESGALDEVKLRLTLPHG